MRSRRRRRSGPDDDGEHPEQEAGIQGIHDDETHSTEETPEHLEKHNASEHSEEEENAGLTEAERQQRAKDLEVWEAFREEYYETVEQLPLSLDRSFTLMRELDERVHDHQGALLPTLRTYAEWRNLNSGRSRIPNDVDVVMDEPEVSTAMGSPAPMDSNSPSEPIRVSSQPVSDLNAGVKENVGTQNTSKKFATKSAQSLSSVPHNSVEAQALLSRIARMTEEVVSASQEKVNVAQAAYDSVDRHIRLLDQAIKEQEMSLSLGMRPGTHPTPIVLPELVVPKTRQGHTAHSPISDAVADIVVDEERVESGTGGDVPTIGISSADAPDGRVAPQSRKGQKKKGKGKKKAQEREATAPLAAIPANIKSVKLNVSPIVPPVVPPNDMPIDANEPRYCYCNQVSFGEMIACDNDRCKREWFHLACVDLEAAPRGKWYCRDCQNTRAYRTRFRHTR